MSSPPGTSLIRRSRALPIALLASVIGLVLCGVTYAVAGPTVHTRDTDLVEPLPAGIVVLSDDLQCSPIPTLPDQQQCQRRVIVRRDGSSADQLANELGDLYSKRGFDMSVQVAGNGRTYFGTFGSCGPQLYLGAMQVSGFSPYATPEPSVSGGRRPRTNPTAPPTTDVPPTTGVAPTTDPSAVDPEANTSTTTAATTIPDPNAAAGSGEPIISSPLEPGAPGENIPGEATPAAPTTTVDTVVVPSESEPPTTLANGPTGDSTNDTTNQQGAGITQVPSDIVVISLSEPYPGAC